ncbi:MAG: HGGxSTG domain-containing protein [Leisingera sp.]
MPVGRSFRFDDKAKPLPSATRPRCGAKNRKGSSCKLPVEPGKRRCRFHGGASTGPKTAVGAAWIAETQHKRWAH